MSYNYFYESIERAEKEIKRLTGLGVHHMEVTVQEDISVIFRIPEYLKRQIESDMRRKP